MGKVLLETSDAVSKDFIIRDEDGDKLAVLSMKIKFSDGLSDAQVEKIADFFDVTGRNFAAWME